MTEVTDDPEAGGSVGGGTTPEEGGTGWSAEEEERVYSSVNVCEDDSPGKSAPNAALQWASENRDAADSSPLETIAAVVAAREKSASALQGDSSSPNDDTATDAAATLQPGAFPTVEAEDSSDSSEESSDSDPEGEERRSQLPSPAGDPGGNDSSGHDHGEARPDDGQNAAEEETGEWAVDENGRGEDCVEIGGDVAADDDGRSPGRGINPKIKNSLKRLQDNDENITELSINGGLPLESHDAMSLADALRSNTTLTTLNISGNEIRDEGAAALADALKHNTTLTTLHMGGNGIGDEGAAALADALKANATLTTFDVHYNDIGTEGAASLADALKTNTTLTTIYMEDNRIGDEGAAALADGLKANTTLTTLNVGGNRIGNKGTAALVDALKANTTLTTIKVGYNGIGAKGAAALGGALKTNATLTTIDVSGSGIGTEGAVSLANALKINNALTTLDLRKNGIGEEGAAALADALKDNTSLTHIGVGYNEIGQDGAAALAHALKANTTLTTINVSGNEIGEEGAAALADAFKVNTTLTTINVGNNRIGVEGAAVLADALKANTTLTTLDMWANGIDDEGATALAEALKTNTTLTDLYVEGNPMSSASQLTLLRWIERNCLIIDHEVASKVHRETFYVQRIDPSRANAATENGPESGTILCWSTGRWKGKRCFPGEAYSARHWQPAVGGEGRNEEIFTAASKRSDDDIESSEETLVSCPIWDAAIVDGMAFKHFLQLFDRLDAQFTLLELKDLINSTKNKDGSTLLHVAAGLDSQVALDLCKFLVEKVGVDFDTITDGSGRTAREIAVGNPYLSISTWARTAGTFLNRYYIEGGLSAPPVHKSATCTVHFAVDMKLKKDDPNRNVALKIMNEKKNGHMERELKIRLTGMAREGEDIREGINRFEIDHAVPLLRYHETPKYDCLVMPMGEKNLHHIIDSEQIAGKDLDKVHAYGKDIAKALHHLHWKHNIIHGDFKPRNVVRINGDMKLIDFDASVRIGNELTEKFSSAYIPPEVARSKFVVKDLEVLKQERDEKENEFNHAVAIRDMEKVNFLSNEIMNLSKQIESASAPVQTTSPTARFSMDIWAFGVTMYYLCTGETLFNTDLSDNLIGESEELRLVTWSGLNIKNLNGVFKESGNQAAREAAQEFLERCLHKDPDQRFQTVNELLSHRFLNKRYSSVAGKVEKIAKNQAENTKIIHQIYKKTEDTINMLSEIQNGLDNMKDQLQKSLRKMTYGILKSRPAPRLFHIVPENSVRDLFDFNNILTKKAKLYFICPVTFSIPRDTLGVPIGYDLTLEPDWVKKYGPALLISLKVLKVAFALGRLAGYPLPNLTSVGEKSNVIQVIADNVIEYKSNEEDGGVLALKLQEVAEAMEIVTTISTPVDSAEVSLEKNLSMDTPKSRKDALDEVSRSYEEVKTIAQHKEDPDFVRSGLVKAVHVDSNDDVLEEYVLPEVVKHFKEKGRECLGWSRDELFRAKIAFMEVVAKGELEKQSKRKQWKGKKRYFILRQSGFLTYYDSKDLRDIDFMGVKGKTKPERVKAVSSTGNCQYELVFTYHGGGTQLFRAASSKEEMMWRDVNKMLQTSNCTTQP